MCSTHSSKRITKTCSCGNVSVCGRRCGIKNNQNGDSDDYLIQIKPRSITIKNIRNLYCTKTNVNMLQIRCSCGSILEIHVGKSAVYSNFVTANEQMRFKGKRGITDDDFTLDLTTNPILSQLIKVEQYVPDLFSSFEDAEDDPHIAIDESDNHVSEYDDEDFDIMFSNSKDIVVGSFHPRAVYLIDA